MSLSNIGTQEKCLQDILENIKEMFRSDKCLFSSVFSHLERTQILDTHIRDIYSIIVVRVVYYKLHINEADVETCFEV